MSETEGKTVELELPQEVGFEKGQNLMISSGVGGLKTDGDRMPPGNINFQIGGKTVVQLGPSGFFVEGRKVTDDAEVYEGFKSFLRRSGVFGRDPIEWPKNKEDLTKIFVDAEAVGDQPVKTLAAVSLALLEQAEQRVDTMNVVLDQVLEIAGAYKRLGMILKAETIAELDVMVRGLLGMDVDSLIAEEIEIKNLADARVRMTVRGSHWGMKAIARSFGPSLARGDGEYWNNLEWKTRCDGVGDVVVTLQRCSGPTKGELLNRAETKLNTLRAVVETALAQLTSGGAANVSVAVAVVADTLTKALADTVPGPGKNELIVAGGKE